MYLDPRQFAYRPNRSTEDAISTTIHTALTHLESRDSFVRLLFIDFSSAFNTVIPSKLVNKLSTLGVPPTLCNWVLTFLTGRPQSVRMGNHTSSTITVNTGTPQGCVLSPTLYTLYTHDCVASQINTSIIMFADDTTVIGLISGGDQSTYRREVPCLVKWFQDNSLSLNVSKTKEMIVEPRRRRKQHPSLHIGETAVEKVSTFKFLGIHISEDLSWTLSITHLVRKSRQRLYFLRRLRKFGMPGKILSSFYRCTIESILTSSITVWFGSCTARDRKALQQVVRAAETITGTALTTLEKIYQIRVNRRARNIIKDSSHLQHNLFTLLPSGRRYRSVKARAKTALTHRPSGL